MKRLRSFFQDKNGKYAVVQPPNLPLYIVLLFWVLSRLAGDTTFGRMVDFGFHASLFLWAYLEIRSGSSPFRRVLGGLVMLGLFAAIS